LTTTKACPILSYSVSNRDNPAGIFEDIYRVDNEIAEDTPYLVIGTSGTMCDNQFSIKALNGQIEGVYSFEITATALGTNTLTTELL
jgi:hypothetical protein